MALETPYLKRPASPEDEGLFLRFTGTRVDPARPDAADLSYAGTIPAVTRVKAALDALQAGKQSISERGAPNGYAPLDANGKLPNEVLPALAITEVFSVNSQAAMLALSAQGGDLCIRTDLSKTFVLSGNNPAVLGNWIELQFPPDAVTSVNGLTGTVVLPSDGAAGVASLRTLGTGATQAAAGNHGHVATAITFTPTGGIASSNVSAALAELDTKKATPAQVSATAVGGDLTGTVAAATIAAGSVTIGKVAQAVWSTSVHGVGTLAARPAAAAGNAGYLYLATDDDGGTLWRSNGVAWVQAAQGVTEQVIGDPTVGGDLTGTLSNAQIAAGAIVNADISNSAAIALSKLAVNPADRSNHSGTQLAATISDFSIAVRNVTPGGALTGSLGAVTFVPGAVTAEVLATGAVTVTKIAAGGVPSSNTYLRGDMVWAAGAGGGGGGDPTMGGDLSGLASGATIVAGAVGTAKIADSAVTTGKIVDGAVTAGKIAAGAVGSTQLAAAGVGTTQLADASVTTAKIAAGAVTTALIADGTIVNGDISSSAAIALSKLAVDPTVRSNHSGTQLAATISDFAASVAGIGVGGDLTGTVAAASVAAGAIGTSKLADVAVTTAKLADGAVSTAKLGDATVTTAKLVDLNVTTGKLADGAVSAAKIASGTITRTQLAASTRAFGAVIGGRRGNLTVETAGASTLRWYNETGATFTVSDLRAVAGTAPTGANIIVTIRRNGVAFSTVTINSAANEGTTTGLSLAVAPGEYLEAWATQIGSSTAGADLVVTARGTLA